MAEKRISQGDGEPDTKKGRVSYHDPLLEEYYRLVQIKAELPSFAGISSSVKPKSPILNTDCEVVLDEVLRTIKKWKRRYQEMQEQLQTAESMVRSYKITMNEYHDANGALLCYSEQFKTAVNCQNYCRAEEIMSLSNILDFGTFPLYKACKAGDLKMVDIVLASEEVVYSCAHDRQVYEPKKSPLRIVCQTHDNHQACVLVKTLLRAGVKSLEHKRREGWPNYYTDKIQGLDCLQVAIQRNLYGVVWLLVNEGFWIYETCKINSKPTTVWELCAGDGPTRSSLLQVWTPQTHRYHKKQVKETVQLTLLIANRNKWNFDTNIMHLLLSFVAYEAKWILEVKKTEEMEGKHWRHGSECHWTTSGTTDLNIRWKLDIEKLKEEVDSDGEDNSEKSHSSDEGDSSSKRGDDE